MSSPSPSVSPSSSASVCPAPPASTPAEAPSSAAAHAGVTGDYDPSWLLTPEQRELQARLLEVCRTVIRPNAILCDATTTYPRKSLAALASLGLLGVFVPKWLGGLGHNHVCTAMVVETIARHGCGSTAMVYTMHLGAVAALLFRLGEPGTHPETEALLRRMDKDVFVGSLSFSDPATGGHFWFPLSSKAWQLSDSQFLMLKASSWTTSAGCANFYVVQTTSPSFEGNFSNLTCFLVYAHEVRANTKDWSALGLRGNMSGPLYTEERLGAERVVGKVGDGGRSNDEIVDPFFVLCSSSCWNGLALGAMDIAKAHVTQKRHADVGMRVCDYPTIQDYFGEAVCDTNASRAASYQLGQLFDRVSNNMDWSLHRDESFSPRAAYLHWCWQAKFTSAKNTANVCDKMLHACGGAGYKTDLGLERFIRDAKAAWVMGPSNELCRQFVGKTALLGMDCLDYWSQRANQRVIGSEIKKLSKDEKVALAKKLLREAEAMELTPAHVAAEEAMRSRVKDLENAPTYFINPFHTVLPYAPPEGTKTVLTRGKYTSLKVAAIEKLTDEVSCFRFAYPSEGLALGSLAGQYVRVRVPRSKEVRESSGQEYTVRYYSIASSLHAGYLDIVLRFESEGEVSSFFRELKVGDQLDFEGNVGGYEYISHQEGGAEHQILICGGGGVTPALQILRTVADSKADNTKLTLFWSVDYEGDLVYKSELDSIVASNNNVKIVYTVKNPSPSWQGESGYLDGVQLAKHLPPFSPASRETTRVVLCGGPSIVLTALQHLNELDCPSECVFVFGPTGDEQIRSAFGPTARIGDHTGRPAAAAAVKAEKQ